jgi:hypothetical protein
MSIASELARIIQAKADLKTAINSKGGNITNETIDQFASKVTALPSPKQEETRTLTPDFSSGNQVIVPTSGKVLSQVTLTKPADLLPENIKKDKNICGVVGTLESGGGETPTDGDYLVRFIDYDGAVLKEQWVDSGDDATPPDLPDYSEATNKRPALTFQGWNNSYTNITGNKDIGATYIPADGKTHVFVRLTKVSGKDVTLYLNKTDTSTLSIDWGDNITTTHTNNGNFNTSHTYSDYGDYEIKIWISSGSGEYGFGNGSSDSVFVGGGQQTQRNMLMYLFIGNNVSSIGSDAFRDCRSLASIDLPANVSSIGSYAFRSCYSLTNIVIPESVPSIGIGTFYSCYSLPSIVIPENVSSIGSSAFDGCFSLPSINIPESVSSIGSGAFCNCYSLTSINIPENVSSIGTDTFKNCYSLTSISIPANVSSMGVTAFYRCYSLTNIVIPESVSSIGNNTFDGCYSILKYVFNRTTPPTLGTSVFLNMNSNTKIYVPNASVNAYKSATNWKTYANYIYPISEMESD